MSESNPTGAEPLCTFCGKTHEEVARLIAGPGVYICDACIGICNDILGDERYQDTSNGWLGWTVMDNDELRSTETIREGLQARVDELRQRKVSWAKIGGALGMSRQAAWERFA